MVIEAKGSKGEVAQQAMALAAKELCCEVPAIELMLAQPVNCLREFKVHIAPRTDRLERKD